MSQSFSRRSFVAAAAAAGMGLTLPRQAAADKPALLGGKRTRTQSFPSWPKMDAREDKALLGVLHSGNWYRGGSRKVDAFEEAYARLTGAKHCIATANGTSDARRRRTTGCARRRSGSPRTCSSARGATWTRSPRRPARSRRTRPNWPGLLDTLFKEQHMIDILDYYDCGQSRGQPITDAANDHREAIRGRVGDLGAWLVRRNKLKAKEEA